MFMCHKAEVSFILREAEEALRHLHSLTPPPPRHSVLFKYFCHHLSTRISTLMLSTQTYSTRCCISWEIFTTTPFTYRTESSFAETNNVRPIIYISNVCSNLFRILWFLFLKSLEAEVPEHQPASKSSQEINFSIGFTDLNGNKEHVAFEQIYFVLSLPHPYSERRCNSGWSRCLVLISCKITVNCSRVQAKNMELLYTRQLKSGSSTQLGFCQRENK